MALVRGAARCLRSAAHLRAPGRQLHILTAEEDEPVFKLLESYQEHVEGRRLNISAASRHVPELHSTKVMPGFSIDSLLLQDAVEAANTTLAGLEISKPAKFVLDPPKLKNIFRQKKTKYAEQM